MLPGLEERAVGRLRGEVAGGLGGDPAERAGVRVAAVGAGHRVVVDARTGREQRAQDVVGVVEVDVEAAVDEDAPEGALGVGRRDARGVPDVAGPHRDGPRVVERRRVQRGDGGVEVRVGAGDRLVGAAGVGERADAVRVDTPGGRDPGREQLHAGRGGRGLAGGERVRLPGKLQPVHAPESGSRSQERSGSDHASF